MSLFSARKGIMALEGLEEEMPLEQAEIHDPEAMVENDLLDMDEASEEANDIVDSSDEALDTVEVLGDIEEHLGEVVESGEGISTPVAQALTAAVEHFNRRMGYQPRKVMPAMETYGGKMSKQRATQLAMESIAEGAKKIMDAIIAAFKRVVEWVTKFFMSFGHAAKKLASRADSILAQVKKGMPEGTFTLKHDEAGFTKHLVTGGVMQRPESFSKEAQAYFGETNNEHKALYAGVEDISKGLVNLKSIFKKPNISPDEVTITSDLALVAVSKAIKETINGFKAIVNESASPAAGTVLFEKPLPFGSVSKFAIIPKPVADKAELIRAMGHFSMYIAKTSAMTDAAEGSKDVVCLQKNDIEALCEKISASMKNNAAEKGVLKTLNETSAFFGSMSSVLKDSVFSSAPSEMMLRNKLANLMGAVSKVVSAYATKFLTTSLHYEATVSKATLDYCAASLKQAAKPAVKPA